MATGNTGRPQNQGLRPRERIPTGVQGLDEVLGGGLLTAGIYLLAGGPGTGKTVLSNQLCFARVRAGARCVYVTLFSELHSRILTNLSSMEFFDPALLERGITYISGARTLREGGLDELFKLLEEEVRRCSASFLVLDGLRIGMHVPGIEEIDHSLFLNRLGALLELCGCTAVLSTLARPGALAPEHTLADALLELTNRTLGRR